MTDKRFTSDYNGDEHLFTHFLENRKPMTKEEVLNQLNELYIQDLAMKKEKEDELLHLKEKYEELLDENKQLKQRNDRQAKRLAELYELMAKKDWESLTEIIDDFCSCEEQLQRESRTYSDWND